MTGKPLSEQQKQTQPLPGEIDPKNAKVEAFWQCNKQKLS